MDQPGPGAREPRHEARWIPGTYLDAVVVALLEAHRLVPSRSTAGTTRNAAITVVPDPRPAGIALPLIRLLRSLPVPLALS